MWTHRGTNRIVGSVRSDVQELLPEESRVIVLQLESYISPEDYFLVPHYDKIIHHFEKLRVELRAVSQNFVSNPLNFGCDADPVHREELVSDLKRQLCELDITPDAPSL